MAEPRDHALLELFLSEVKGKVAEINTRIASLRAATATNATTGAIVNAVGHIETVGQLVGIDADGLLAKYAGRSLSQFYATGPATNDVQIALLELVTGYWADLTEVNPADLSEWMNGQTERRESLESDLAGMFKEPVGTVVMARQAAVEVGFVETPRPGQTAFIKATDKSMLAVAMADLETQCQALNDGLLHLESSNNPEADIKVLMRAAHSVKGVARMIGLDMLVEVSHAMEDFFVQMGRDRTTPNSGQIDLLLECNDLIGEACHLDSAGLNSWCSQHQSHFSAFLASLKSGLRKQGEKEGSDAPKVSSGRSMFREEGKRSGGDDRAIRIAADRLTRMIGLSAEAMVETNRFRAITETIGQTKRNVQDTLAKVSRERTRKTGNGDTGHHELLSALREDLIDVLAEVDRNGEDLESQTRRFALLLESLHRESIGCRMRPFGDILRGFPRLVRDLARQLGKRIEFKVEGGETGVDREVLQKIEAPLNHIVRNACDHGIETPVERMKAGKSGGANVVVSARHQSGLLLVEVSEDGRGIDVEKIRTRVLERGLANVETAKDLSRDELLEFLFLPGFSTASAVTEVSGRGVGLDVVMEMIVDVGGTVNITTEAGKGTTFHLRLPITRSIIQGLVVTIAEELYALPLERLAGVVRLPASEIAGDDDGESFVSEGQRVPLFQATRLLGFEETPASGEILNIVIVGSGDEKIGLQVEALVGEEDLVVRPIKAELGKLPNVSVAALNADGQPVLILDTDDLQQGARRFEQVEPDATGANPDTPSVLIVDDSSTIRATQQRILTEAGYRVEVAVDGMDGWNALLLGEFDLVLSDVDMPRMNGMELVAKIRKEQRWLDLPVIIVSYRDRDEDQAKALEAGADRFISKNSIQERSFLEAVAELLGQEP